MRLLFKTIIFQGNEYIVTHEFALDHIFAFREIGHGLIEVYHHCKGADMLNNAAPSILQDILSAREYLMEVEQREAQEQLNFEQQKSIDEGSGRHEPGSQSHDGV